VSTKAQRLRRTKDRVFWKRSSSTIYGIEDVKKHRIGKIKKPRKEEQKE